MLIPMQKIVFDFNKGNGNVYMYLAVLAQNGKGTLKERSEIFWERSGNKKVTER